MTIIGLAAIVPRVCWPWRLRFLEPEQPVRGLDCVYCRRAIAAPVAVLHNATCCYCALERGIIPEEDVPFGTLARA